MTKFYITLLVSLFLVPFINAQNSIFLTEDEDDSLLVRKYALHDGHWAGIDAGMNCLMSQQLSRNFGANPQWNNSVPNSFYININALDHKFVFVEDKIGLTTGIGFNWTQVAFKNNFTIEEINKDTTSNELILKTYYSNTQFTSNKLRISYIQVPLLLEFTSKKKWLSVGVTAGYKIGASTKQVYESKTKEISEKVKGRFGIHTVKIDATLRGGYKDWGIFMNYSLSSLVSSMGNVHPFTFGLSFNY